MVRKRQPGLRPRARDAGRRSPRPPARRGRTTGAAGAGVGSSWLYSSRKSAHVGTFSCARQAYIGESSLLFRSLAAIIIKRSRIGKDSLFPPS